MNCDACPEKYTVDEKSCFPYWCKFWKKWLLIDEKGNIKKLKDCTDTEEK